MIIVVESETWGDDDTWWNYVGEVIEIPIGSIYLTFLWYKLWWDFYRLIDSKKILRLVQAEICWILKREFW